MDISHLLLEHFDHLLATPDSVERLNQAILDLAVRGKLVPQDPTDEPASELLKRTQAEKAKLIEQGKLANSDPLPPIRENERSFTLPEGWAWTRFGDITINRDGERIPVSKEDRELRQGEYDYYGASGVIDKVDSYLFDKPLLLIGEDGANLINRSTPIAFLAHGKYWVNNHAHVLDAIDFVILKYLEVYINAIDLKPYITGTAQPKMNQTKMNSIVVAVPPLAEQRRIVARVEQLFAQTRQLADLLSKSQTDLTHLNEAALHHLLAADTPEDFNARWDFIAEHFDLLYSEPEHIAPLRQTILELAVRGKLTRQDPSDEPASELLKRIRAEKERLVKEGKIKEPKLLSPIQHDENLFELPSGWTWCRIGDVGEAISNAVVDGPFGSSLKLSDYDDAGEYPVVSITNIDEGFDLAKLRKLNQSKFEQLKRSAVYPGDVLVAKIGSSWGKAGFYPTEMPVGIIPANLLKITVNHHLSRMYIFFFLRCQSQRNQLEKLVKYTAQPAFNVTAFKNLLFPLPPLAEQRRIVTRVEQLLGLCDALETKLQAAQVEREKLVEAVVAGVADPHPHPLPCRERGWG